MRLLAVVVTFYPQKDLLDRNIKSFIGCVDKVLIWENTPITERSQYRFLKHEKIEYCGDDINSISHGLNYAWRYAGINGFDVLLTMDQDSEFMDFEAYWNTSISYLKSSTCLIGPYVSCHDEKEVPKTLNSIDKNAHLITSGLLIPVKLLDAIGGYCEDFKIDGVDLDLCIRVRSLGADIIRNSNGLLIQTFGTPYERKLFGKVFVGANYGCGRLYEIFYSHVILYKRYQSQLAYSMLKIYLRHFVPRILLWENEKIQKVMAIIKGIYNGLKDGNKEKLK